MLDELILRIKLWVLEEKFSRNNFLTIVLYFFTHTISLKHSFEATASNSSLFCTRRVCRRILFFILSTTIVYYSCYQLKMKKLFKGLCNNYQEGGG